MSSYRFFTNNSRDFYDYTFNRILDAVDENERGRQDSNYIAQIISGDFLGGDTTTPQQNVRYVNLNGKVAMAFKIRFVEKSTKYNFVENPYPTDGEPISQELKETLVSMHDDAFLESNGLPTIPKFGDIVVCSKLPGRVFVIEKVLTNNNIFTDLLTGGGVGGLAGLFGGGLPGFLGSGGLESLVGISQGVDRVSGQKWGVDAKTGKRVSPRIRTYIGPRAEWRDKDIENGVFLEGFHEKIPSGLVDGQNPIFIKDVVPDFIELAKAFEQNFKKKIKISDSFRSWTGQLDVRRRKPNLAAKPGTSNHGWGVAFDWSTKHNGVSSFASETYQWMYQNAPRYNFWNPKWARPGGSKPEAWHFEYLKPGELYKK